MSARRPVSRQIRCRKLAPYFLIRVANSNHPPHCAARLKLFSAHPLTRNHTARNKCEEPNAKVQRSDLPRTLALPNGQGFRHLAKIAGSWPQMRQAMFVLPAPLAKKLIEAISCKYFLLLNKSLTKIRLRKSLSDSRTRSSRKGSNNNNLRTLGVNK